MISMIEPLREVNLLTVLIRMLLAAGCGTVIGLERSSKNRPAGFRTHILVCVGAATASLTGHYMYLVMQLPVDVSRIGAQVIAGLGFIGAGTIVVTKRQSIKGLTTAAGLWAAGIVGLAIGAGFYEGGLICAALILLTETVFSSVGLNIKRVPGFRIDLSYRTKSALDHMMRCCKDRNIAITDLQITGASEEEGMEPEYHALVSLRPNSHVNYEDLGEHITSISGVIRADFMSLETGERIPV